MTLTERPDQEDLEGDPYNGHLVFMRDDKNDFDEDTEEALKLPKVKPEVTADDPADADGDKKADSAFDDLEIEVDMDELKKESEGESGGRKY